MKPLNAKEASALAFLARFPYAPESPDILNSLTGDALLVGNALIHKTNYGGNIDECAKSLVSWANKFESKK